MYVNPRTMSDALLEARIDRVTNLIELEEDWSRVPTWKELLQTLVNEQAQRDICKLMGPVVPIRTKFTDRTRKRQLRN